MAQCAKGAAWGDYDDDGQLDLFVSNMNGPSRLYHNDGDGTFADVGPDARRDRADRSFACWFWDYDNDGRLDLFVNDYAHHPGRDRRARPRPADRQAEPAPALPQPRRRGASAT